MKEKGTSRLSIMKPPAWTWFFILLTGCAWAGMSAAAEDNRKLAEPALDSFRVVWESNIFDPNRRPIAAASVKPATADATPTESFSLLGALIQPEGAYAFFNGTRSEYTKVVSLGETIAGYRVVEIATNRVVLEKEGNRLEFPVGWTYSRQNTSEWTLAAASRSSLREDSGRRSDDSPRSGSDSGRASDRGRRDRSSNEDTLQRLRNQRERETRR